MERTGQDKLRLVFMGTPAFAAAILDDLLGWRQGEMVAVFTQPDRPCGRGQQCRPSEVKALALEKGLPVFQPASLKKDPGMSDLLSSLRPDIFIVAAYGLILSHAIMTIPSIGCLNVHASLLPKYRGAAPIQRAIMDGEQETGVSIMLMEPTLDTGPVLLSKRIPIGQDTTAGQLHDQLAAMSGGILIEAIQGWLRGSLVPKPQDDANATYAAKIDKAEGRISWRQSAAQVHNHIRALTPWPGACYDWSRENGEMLRLTLLPGKIGQPVPPGTSAGAFLGPMDNAIGIACADRAYLVNSLIPANKALQDAASFTCGYLSASITCR